MRYLFDNNGNAIAPAREVLAMQGGPPDSGPNAFIADFMQIPGADLTILIFTRGVMIVGLFPVLKVKLTYHLINESRGHARTAQCADARDINDDLMVDLTAMERCLGEWGL